MLASAASGEARGLFSPWRIYCRSIISDRPMTEQEWAAERATVINDVVEELPVPRTSSSNVYLLRTQ